MPLKFDSQVQIIKMPHLFVWWLSSKKIVRMHASKQNMYSSFSVQFQCSSFSVQNWSQLTTNNGTRHYFVFIVVQFHDSRITYGNTAFSCYYYDVVAVVIYSCLTLLRWSNLSSFAWIWYLKNYIWFNHREYVAPPTDVPMFRIS